ncbi:MAG TPA: hypothetical protein VHU81_20250 [Thermoanaerobaculia bacterium]|nr:hypothetical protein [Thermoanaerobaculia bacterium]
MTTVQELNLLHRHYSDVSHRFRAAWTFHQFLQSLNKTILQRSDDHSSPDFQRLYAELKEVSQNLNAFEGERMRARLDIVDRRLSELILALEEEDNRVAPYFFRQFFRRVKSYDEKILTQLVKFYLYTHPGEAWPPDRLDKVDFLLARLSEEEDDRTGEPILGDSRRLGEIFQGLWQLLGTHPPDPQLVEANRREIETVRASLADMESLDQLNDSQLVRRFREIKHGLGNFYFEPSLLLPVQETNLALKNRIQKLYRQEERRIVSEYQRVFELEREVPLDTELDQDLAQFREEIEAFEKQLQSQEFKLDSLAQIRQRVRSLLPRLTAASNVMERPANRPPDTGEYTINNAGLAATAPMERHEDVLGEHYRNMITTLREVNPDLPPERVVLLPEIYPLRLEPREVTAYRRVFGRKEHDVELERFLLEAAALRVRINDEAQEITSILDETSVTGDAPIYNRARATARLADSYLWRFQHLLDERLFSGDLSEGRQIQLLRMRLMRDYSGLWLLAYKPVLSQRRPGGTLV